MSRKLGPKTAGTVTMISALCALALPVLLIINGDNEKFFWSGFIAGVFALSGLLGFARALRIYAGME